MSQQFHLAADNGAFYTFSLSYVAEYLMPSKLLHLEPNIIL